MASFRKPLSEADNIDAAALALSAPFVNHVQITKYGAGLVRLSFAEATAPNAVAESSTCRTKVGGARFMSRNIRVTEHDVSDITVSIRHPHLQQPGAKVEHDRSCGTGRQLDALNGTAVRGDAIVVDGDGHEASLDMKESRPKGVETCGIG